MLAINMSVRYLAQDYRRGDVQRYELSPRLALAVKPIENLVLRGGFIINLSGIMSIPVEDGIDDVNRAEEAMHYVIGGEYVSVGNLLKCAEGYYKKLENLTGKIRDYGRQTQIFTHPDSGNVKGVDLFVKRAISTRLMGSLGYAYAVAKESMDDQEFFREFYQRHTITLNSTCQLSRSWCLHIGWRFHTGNPTIV